MLQGKDKRKKTEVKEGGDADAGSQEVTEWERRRKDDERRCGDKNGRRQAAARLNTMQCSAVQCNILGEGRRSLGRQEPEEGSSQPCPYSTGTLVPSPSGSPVMAAAEKPAMWPPMLRGISICRGR